MDLSKYGGNTPPPAPSGSVGPAVISTADPAKAGNLNQGNVFWQTSVSCFQNLLPNFSRERKKLPVNILNVLISSSFLTSFIAVHFSLHLHYLLAEFLFLLEILTQNSLNGNFIIIKHTDSKLFINQRGLLTPIPLNMLYILY